MRDFQKNRVYSWEREYLSHKDHSHVPFDQVKAIVNYVWSGEGLEYPPLVELLDPRDKTALARANRQKVWVKPEGLPTWVVLHELSHTLTCDIDGGSNLHGPRFVGIYMKLLEKYLGIPLSYLMFTATKAGVKFDITAKTYLRD